VSYAVYVGKNHCADGHGYLAGYGDEPSSHWLDAVPRKSHEAGSVIEVGVTPQALTPGVRSHIPQVPETLRYLSVGYSYYLGVPSPLTNGGLNEHGVAVRDVWSPSSPRLCALTPPDQTGPNYSDLARIVLERAKTAREGVETIGELIAQHGYSTYGGNSHLIADSDEAWVVIEFAGGQGLWVAERLDGNSIRVSRPGYILEIPISFHDDPDYLGAPHLVDFAVQQSWFIPDGQTSFNVNEVYGDAKGRSPAAAWMESELARRAARREQITFQDVVWAIRTERLTGDTAGYGQLVPLAAEPDPDLRVLWHAPIGPIAAPLTPFFLGVESIPPEFRQHRYLTTGEGASFVDDSDPADSASVVPQRIEATRSAVFTFKRLLYLVTEHYEQFLPEVTPVFEALENQLLTDLAEVVRSARILADHGEPGLARQMLTRFSETQALRSLDLGEALLNSMEARSRLIYGVREERSWRGPEQLW
jgi:dipeptidase